MIRAYEHHWFPLIRPAIKSVFLGGFVREGVGWPAINVRFLPNFSVELPKQRHLFIPIHPSLPTEVFGMTGPPNIPKCSMYGIFTYMWLKSTVNVGIYTTHGAYGIYIYTYISHPRHPKSSKYLVSRCLEPLKPFSGDVWDFKHLLTRYLDV